MGTLLLTNKMGYGIDTFCVSMIKYLKDYDGKGNCAMLCVYAAQKLKLRFAAGFFAAGLFPVFKS